MVWHRCHTRVREFIQIHVWATLSKSESGNQCLVPLFKAHRALCRGWTSTRISRNVEIKTRLLGEPRWWRHVLRENDIGNGVFQHSDLFCNRIQSCLIGGCNNSRLKNAIIWGGERRENELFSFELFPSTFFFFFKLIFRSSCVHLCWVAQSIEPRWLNSNLTKLSNNNNTVYFSWLIAR